MTGLSVIICTHNPRPDCLRRTLESLAAQTLPKEQWELLIVDNASQPPLAERCDIAWHPRGRHFREDRLGITFARLCGINNSTSQLLVFADDDNVLVPDYLENAVDIAARHPHLAAFGAGILEPEFEIPPPPELDSLLFLLALRSVPTARWSNHPQGSSCLPFGAGLCVRRKTAAQFAALVERLGTGTVLGRKGGQLSSHEDDLFSWAAAGDGQGFGIFPELRIRHLIAAGRLNRGYFLRLIYYSTFSHWILHYLLAGEQPQKNTFFRAVHIGLHALRNGFFSARCQWARAKGEDRAARFIFENQLSPMAGAAAKSGR
jgi:glycosyltransferase involved in cell wall biosynthesis